VNTHCTTRWLLETCTAYAAQWTSPRNTSNFRGFVKRKVSPY